MRILHDGPRTLLKEDSDGTLVFDIRASGRVAQGHLRRLEATGLQRAAADGSAWFGDSRFVDAAQVTRVAERIDEPEAWADRVSKTPAQLELEHQQRIGGR